MSRMISTSELTRTAEGIISYCSDKVNALPGLKPPIYNFEGDTSLEGVAWSTARGQVSNHLIVIGGAIVAYESMEEDAHRLQSIIAGEETIYNETLILDGIDFANRRIQDLTDTNASWSRLMLAMPEDALGMSGYVDLGNTTSSMQLWL